MVENNDEAFGEKQLLYLQQPSFPPNDHIWKQITKTQLQFTCLDYLIVRKATPNPINFKTNSIVFLCSRRHQFHVTLVFTTINKTVHKKAALNELTCLPVLAV